jgi:hypothetical protein
LKFLFDDMGEKGVNKVRKIFFSHSNKYGQKKEEKKEFMNSKKVE